MANYISQITLPNDNTYELRDKNLKIYSGTCDTAAETAIKEVNCPDSFQLETGAVIFVTFTNTNSATAANLKLRVNNTTDETLAKPIKHQYNNTNEDIPLDDYIRANQTYQFYYDGTNWVIFTNYDTNNKVSLNNSTTSKWRKVLLHPTENNASTTNYTTTTTSGILYSRYISVQPSTGTLHATKFDGSGASLTNLNASNIASGTVPFANLPTGTGENEIAIGNHTHNFPVTSVNGDTGDVTTTDEKVKQTPTTTNANYELLFSESAYSENTNDTELTEGARKTSDLTYNPSTNTLTIGTGTLTATDYNGNAATATNATTHIANTNNPHGVTKAQLDLDNVTNHAQVTSLSYNTTTHKLTYKVSNGNDIEIATFGSLAEDSTDYLPLSGGDMSGNISLVSGSTAITNAANKRIYWKTTAKTTGYITVSSSGLMGIHATGDLYFRPGKSGAIATDTGAIMTEDAFYPYSNNGLTLGTASKGWLSVYATTFIGSLNGNANTATSWANDRTVYVDLATVSTDTTINGDASNAAAIALGIDGILGIANGGTGISTINPHYILIGPASGANSAAPTWRSLSNDDLPGSGAITIAQIPVALGESISLSDLNLASALHFVGTTTTTIADNDTTATIIINGDNYSPSQGDVVLTSDGEEFLWNGSRWDLLGDASSFKKVQAEVNSQTVSGVSTRFVSSITQNSEGVITVTASDLDTSGAWGGNAASATVLETSRTLWGQSFDGSSNITGNLTDVGPNFKLPSNENDFYFLKSDGTTNANGYFGTVYATTFSGAASNATTSASTDTLYLVGVKSDATSTLLHDISITASADVLTIGKLTITGGTTNSSIASDGTLTINNTTQALNLQTTSAALTISTQNGNLEAKSTGSGTVKLTGTTGAMTISTTSGELNIETTSGNTAIDSGGTVSISSASGKTITINSGSTLYLNKPTTSSIVFTSGGASTSNEIARFNTNGKFQLKDGGTQNTHELYVNGDSAFNGKIVFGTQTSNSINENAYMQWNATDQSIDFLFA